MIILIVINNNTLILNSELTLITSASASIIAWQTSGTVLDIVGSEILKRYMRDW